MLLSSATVLFTTVLNVALLNCEVITGVIATVAILTVLGKGVINMETLGVRELSGMVEVVLYKVELEFVAFPTLEERLVLIVI